MKKIILSLSLVLSTIGAAFAISPVATEDPIYVAGIATPINACKYHTSIRLFIYDATGNPVYYGPFYYFNSLADAHTYILQVFPPVEYPNPPHNGGATIICTKTVIGGV